jgi:hypothetical protein
MFLHALLFFLLGTSVFAAPVQTRLAQVGDGHSHHAVVQEATRKSHIGLWYPVDGVLSAVVVSRILLIFIQVSHLCHGSNSIRSLRFSLAMPSYFTS